MTKAKRLTLNIVLLTVLVFSFLTSAVWAVTRSKTANWAGYKVKFSASSSQKVDRVSASWVVPTVQASVQFEHVSEWIGIGYTNSDLVQIGTLQTTVRGRVSYSAWYQRLPEDLQSVPINVLDGKVGPGTVINAAVEKSTGDSWILTLIANGTIFQKKATHLGSQQLSAEWILELPTPVHRSMRTASLAHFGNVTFSAARASVNGDQSTVKDLPYAIDDLIDSSYTTVVASTSDLLEDGESFIVTYGALGDNAINVLGFIILRAPYIGLIILAGVVSTVVYAERVRRRKEKL